jgi:hypothetical protein
MSQAESLLKGRQQSILVGLSIIDTGHWDLNIILFQVRPQARGVGIFGVGGQYDLAAEKTFLWNPDPSASGQHGITGKSITLL